MPDLDTISVRLTADIDDFRRGMRTAEQGVDAFGRKAGEAGEHAKGLGKSTEGAGAGAKTYVERAREAYSITGELTRGQASLIRRLEEQSAVTQLTARETAAYTALRRANTTADTEAGRVIQSLALRQHDLANASTGAARATGLARHEMVNLSRQVQDVGVSLVSGQSPFMVLAQQGTQIADIFATSGGSVSGFFSQMASGVGRVITPLRLVVGGVAGIGATAVLAATSWQSSQLEITRSLQGIGRASGVTVADINRIGSAASSTFGLSISEAQIAASTFAATGRIARNEIAELTGLTKDFAATLNVDVGEAAQILAKAFADPVKGLEALTQRLGGMSPLLRAQVEHYTNIGDRAAAQQRILAAIQPQITRASEVTGFWSASWTAVANTASDAFTKVGQGMSSITGIGLEAEQKLARLQQQLESARAVAEATRAPSVFRMYQAEAERLSQEIAKLQAEMQLPALEQAAEQFRRLTMQAQGFADAIDKDTAQLRALNEQIKVMELVRAQPEKAGLTMAPDQSAQQEQALLRMREQRDTLVALQQAYGGVSIATAVRLQQLQFEAQLAMQTNEVGRQSVLIEQQRAQMKLAGVPAAEQERLITQTMITQQRQLVGAYQQSAAARLLQGQQTLQAAQLEARVAGLASSEQERYRLQLQMTQQIQSQLFTQLGAAGQQAVESGNKQALAAQLAQAAYEELVRKVGEGAAKQIAAGEEVDGVEKKIIETYRERAAASEQTAAKVIEGYQREIAAARQLADEISTARRNAARVAEETAAREAAASSSSSSSSGGYTPVIYGDTAEDRSNREIAARNAEAQRRKDAYGSSFATGAGADSTIGDPFTNPFTGRTGADFINEARERHQQFLIETQNRMTEALNANANALNDNTSALQLSLDPLMTQGHDYLNSLRIGYYKAATGLSGIVSGTGSGDRTPVHMMLEPGEQVDVTPRDEVGRASMSTSSTANDNRQFNQTINIIGGGSSPKDRLTARQLAQGFMVG